MGLLDKLKNALFEVEYVEVEEPPKKEKKVKEKAEKPIAKKIVLPGRREEKIEELQEEELKDEDFEIRPKEEVKEQSHEDFKFMDDEDFKIEDDYVPEEPEILQVLDETEEVLDEKKEEVKVYPERRIEEKPEVYSSSPNAYKESKPYGMDQTYNVPVHGYGTYEKKEEKTYFKPSPIISPIYGILDKNYKKEDVKEKKDVRISSFSRTNVSVDDIRNKAFGEKRRLEKEEPEVDETKFEVDEEDDETLLVDLSDHSKPEVKEITMGDALEYFQDLGLEYNVDYVDASKEKNVPKKEEPQNNEEEINPVVQDIEDVVESVDGLETPVLNVPDEKKDDDTDDDNLFDLIDSMYQENE